MKSDEQQSKEKLQSDKCNVKFTNPEEAANAYIHIPWDKEIRGI
jgi:hypothetical protein